MKGLGELTEGANEDFYMAPYQDESPEAAQDYYELSLVRQLLGDLVGKLSEFDRQDPSTFPRGVLADVSCALLALSKEVDWAVGVASNVYRSRTAREGRHRRLLEHGGK